MVRAITQTRGFKAVAVCILTSLAAGLLFGSRAGLGLVGPIGAVALFLVLVWDIRLVVPLLIVMLPFGPKFEMVFGNLYLSTAILMITYLAWAVRVPLMKQGLTFKYNAVLLAVVGLMAAFVLSSLQNYEFLFSNRSALLKFIQFLLYTGLFVIVYQMEFSRVEIKRLLILVVVSGGIQGLVGALQWLRNPGFYVAGTFDGEHNLYASYVAFVAILLTGVALETKRTAVLLASVSAVAIIVYSIALSFSRTAYVSLLVSLLLFGFLPISKRKRVLVPAITLAASAAALVIVPASVSERIRALMQTATGEYVALSFRYRLRMWRIALEDFKQSPLLGKGAWAYELRDNFFVKAGAESGIVGLAVFLLLVLLILRASWRLVLNPPRDDFMRGIVVGFFPAAVGSLIVFNLAGDFLSVHRFIGVFWIALALILQYRSAEGNARHGTHEAA